MSNDKEAVDVLSELLRSKLSKSPELAAKQARLLAILAAQKVPAKPPLPPAQDPE